MANRPSGRTASTGWRRSRLRQETQEARVLDLDALVGRWQVALDAAEKALGAAAGALSEVELHTRRARLRNERKVIATLLADVASAGLARPASSAVGARPAVPTNALAYGWYCSSIEITGFGYLDPTPIQKPKSAGRPKSERFFGFLPARI
jgi:hypothetical protein